MADFVLTLGGVGFQDFEVPESIAAGGGQALATRKYPGGVRTVQTMGPDDAPLTWTGWFEADTALARCQQIDIMRRQGQAVVAAWSIYSYLVVIKAFSWKFRRYYHIEYAITLEVVQDLTQPPVQSSADADTQINSDASDASSDATTLSQLRGPNGLDLSMP